MSNDNPYKPGRPPQWWIEAVYNDQLKRGNNYIDPFIHEQKDPPDVTICGITYSGKTGKKIDAITRKSC